MVAPTFTVAKVLSIGAVAHVIIGVYDARRVRAQQLANEQRRVSVLNRMIRHNLRNETTVLGGHASLIAERVDDPELRDSAEAVAKSAAVIGGLAKDANRLQAAFERRPDARGAVPVEPLIEDAAEAAREAGAETVAVDVEPCAALADDRLATAVEELATNAPEHGARPRSSYRLARSTAASKSPSPTTVQDPRVREPRDHRSRPGDATGARERGSGFDRPGDRRRVRRVAVDRDEARGRRGRERRRDRHDGDDRGSGTVAGVAVRPTAAPGRTVRSPRSYGTHGDHRPVGPRARRRVPRRGAGPWSVSAVAPARRAVDRLAVVRVGRRSTARRARASADLADFLAHDDHVSFEVSTNEPPYKGVRGRGHATVTPDADKELLRSLLERYLDGVDNPTGDRLLRPEREEIRVRIEPERLHSWDYSGRMGPAER